MVPRLGPSDACIPDSHTSRLVKHACDAEIDGSEAHPGDAAIIRLHIT